MWEYYGNSSCIRNLTQNHEDFITKYSVLSDRALHGTMDSLQLLAFSDRVEPYKIKYNGYLNVGVDYSRFVSFTTGIKGK